MKKTFNIFLAAVLLISFSFSQASASSGEKHILETVIIGTGVALLGTALIHHAGNHKKNKHYSHNYNNYKQPPAHYLPTRKYNLHRRGTKHHGQPHPYARQQAFQPHKIQGNWIIKKIWISPKYEKRWIPGHFNKRNRWIKGKNALVMVKNGYWEKKRVWLRSDR